MFFHVRNFEFENRLEINYVFHIFLNFSKKCVNYLILSHFCDFWLKRQWRKFKKIFFAKISLNCNENDLCTKIQIDPNIFVENNDFWYFFWNWIPSKQLDLQKNVKMYVTKMLIKSCNLNVYSICKSLYISFEEMGHQINQDLHD